jgi:hypothetical protein
VGQERAERWEQLARVRWAPVDSIQESARSVAIRFARERAPATYQYRLEAIVSTRYATEMELDPSSLIDSAVRAASVEPAFAAPALRSRMVALAELGRVRAASALLDTVARNPLARANLPPPLFLRILWGVSGLYPADSLPAQLALLDRDESLRDYAPRLRRFLYLSQGHLDAAERVAAADPPPGSQGEGVEERGLSLALDAYAMELRGDTSGAIERMREAIRTAGYSIEALRFFTSGPLFVHAVTLSRRPDTRAEGIRRLRWQLYSGGFTVFAYLALAEALEADGDNAGAAQAHAHVIRLWENADPHLQPHVTRAREALARLTSERDR